MQSRAPPRTFEHIVNTATERSPWAGPEMVVAEQRAGLHLPLCLPLLHPDPVRRGRLRPGQAAEPQAAQAEDPAGRDPEAQRRRQDLRRQDDRAGVAARQSS